MPESCLWREASLAGTAVSALHPGVDVRYGAVAADCSCWAPAARVAKSDPCPSGRRRSTEYWARLPDFADRLRVSCELASGVASSSSNLALNVDINYSAENEFRVNAQAASSAHPDCAGVFLLGSEAGGTRSGAPVRRSVPAVRAEQRPVFDAHQHCRLSADRCPGFGRALGHGSNDGHCSFEAIAAARAGRCGCVACRPAWTRCCLDSRWPIPSGSGHAGVAITAGRNCRLLHGDRSGATAPSPISARLKLARPSQKNLCQSLLLISTYG